LIHGTDVASSTEPIVNTTNITVESAVDKLCEEIDRLIKSECMACEAEEYGLLTLIEAHNCCYERETLIRKQFPIAKDNLGLKLCSSTSAIESLVIQKMMLVSSKEDAASSVLL